MHDARMSGQMTVFVLFFGLALIEALQKGNWLLVSFWLAIGLLFLWSASKSRNNPPLVKPPR